MDAMTEDEARSKWCPKARVSERSYDTGEPLPAHNRWENENGGARIPTSCYCIASKCMAWRRKNELPTKGYCGAFGATP